VLFAALVFGTALPEVARAQDSVADKANARTLATEGIDLFNEGRYAEALDRLQRAQALFDAPIHLLYIARAQTKLGQLVEATETYRRLIRVELTADTPAAVREAVEAGDSELDGVDARLAMLRIEVVPAGERGLVLVIDGQTVSSAVVGVDRPLNPGHHRVQATVPDGRSAETSIELGEGSRASVRLELGPAPAAPSTEAAVAVEASPKLAWFLGAGLGLALPVGKIARNPDVPMSDYASAGATLELYGGLRFARYLGAKLFVQASGYAASSPSEMDFGGFGAGAGASAQARVDPTARSQAFGLSVLVGSAPSRLGGYGELGLVLGERLALEQELTLSVDQCGGKASRSLTMTGSALRIGGGAYIPMTRLFQLVPFLHGSFGRFTHASADADCNGLSAIEGLSGGLEDARRAVHGTIQLGIGGELLLGVR
jgi:hypothetical protein